MSIRTFESAAELSRQAAVELVNAVAAATGTFHLVLSGGSTPKAMYALLASPEFKDQVDWSRIQFWWGDERFVPPTDPASNEGMARAALLDHVPVEATAIHPMFREGSAEDAAAFYDADLRNSLAGEGFDLLLLGLGPDAHTASLFPGDPSIDETTKWVVASEGAAGVKQRLTLTPPVLTAAKRVLFLAAGPDKAEPLFDVLKGEYNPHRFPAQIVARDARNVEWFVDTAAIAKLG